MVGDIDEPVESEVASSFAGGFIDNLFDKIIYKDELEKDILEGIDR